MDGKRCQINCKVENYMSLNMSSLVIESRPPCSSTLSFSKTSAMQKNFPLSGSVLAICISFVIDNIDKISHVSRDFLSSSNLACCYILTVYKRQPLLNATITPLLTQSPSLIEPSIKTLIKLHNIVISRARAVGIKISNPRKVPLEELIHQIQACNFNLFFQNVA